MHGLAHKQLVITFGTAAALSIACIALGWYASQENFWSIVLPFGLAFSAYAWVIGFSPREYREKTFKLFFALAILLRVLLLFSFPALSDDIYRFIWDGRLLVAGVHPFAELPRYYLEHMGQVPGLDADLFSKLNSPDYFTIYPPVCQATFALGAWAAPENIYLNNLVLKFLMLGFETGSLFLIIRLLKKMGKPVWLVLIYGLNPLILVEIMGNLHYEGAMIFFLLLGVWFLEKKNLPAAGIAWSFSIASKLLPLMLVPLFFRKLGWKRFLFWGLWMAGGVLVLFAPMVDFGVLTNFSKSINLYFRNFEFNASIYYLVRWMGFQIAGYNLIGYLGPALALLSVGWIFYQAFKKTQGGVEDLVEKMFWSFAGYLLLATTVHPWYMSMLILFAVFLKYRFAVVWSGMVVLSYSHYHGGGFEENYLLIVLEYATIGLVMWWESKPGKYRCEMNTH